MVNQTLSRQELLHQLDRRDVIIFELMQNLRKKEQIIFTLKRIWWVKIHLFLSRNLP